jgi:hypothetical protein
VPKVGRRLCGVAKFCLEDVDPTVQLFNRGRERVCERENWPDADRKENPEKEQFRDKMLMHFRTQKFPA